MAVQNATGEGEEEEAPPAWLLWSRMVQSGEAILRDVQKQTRELAAQVRELRTELTTTKSKHAQELAAVKTELYSELTKSKHAQELAAVKTELRMELTTTKSEHTQELAAVKTELYSYGLWLYEPLGTCRRIAALAWMEFASLEASLILRRRIAELDYRAVEDLFDSTITAGYVEDVSYPWCLRMEGRGRGVRDETGRVVSLPVYWSIQGLEGEPYLGGGKDVPVSSTLFHLLRLVEAELAARWQQTPFEVHSIFGEWTLLTAVRNISVHVLQVYDIRHPSPGMHDRPESTAQALQRLDACRRLPALKRWGDLKKIRAQLDVAADIMQWRESMLPEFFRSQCYAAALADYTSKLKEWTRSCLLSQTVTGYTSEDEGYYYVDRVDSSTVAIDKNSGEWSVLTDAGWTSIED